MNGEKKKNHRLSDPCGFWTFHGYATVSVIAQDFCVFFTKFETNYLNSLVWIWKKLNISKTVLEKQRTTENEWKLIGVFGFVENTSAKSLVQI